MCISLEVSRTEACVADPSRLIIRSIIPTYMSSDAFLDSAIFNISKNEEAHGGFDSKETGNLATGLGREKISAVLPLYLFKEHYEIARKKSPPVYGFMCTLDIMGYVSSQGFIIPFLVLNKAIENLSLESSVINKRIFEQVKATCM
jgi:hypothetical protein